jgi:hypothetical protein
MGSPMLIDIARRIYIRYRKDLRILRDKIMYNCRVILRTGIIFAYNIEKVEQKYWETWHELFEYMVSPDKTNTGSLAEK